MKVLTVILALFFLSLNTIPCSDTVSENCGTEIHIHTDSQGGESENTDHCSPFCHCHCCHTHINTHLSDEDFLSTILLEKKDGYAVNAGQDISMKLLQPPQQL